jgi:hypothetical protein
VVDSGGIVIAEPIDIADMGQMAIFADPSGYAMGIWSPGTFHGFPRDGRVGAPAWFELLRQGLPRFAGLPLVGLRLDF